jgi:hypothetical protein
MEIKLQVIIYFVSSKAGGCEHFTCDKCKTDFCRMCSVLFCVPSKNRVKIIDYEIINSMNNYLEMHTTKLFIEQYHSCSLCS